MDKPLTAFARLHAHQWEPVRETIGYEGTPVIIHECVLPDCSATWIETIPRAA